MEVSSAISLDHVFILTQPGATAADRLIDLGMKEGLSRQHKGQGTTNRQFLFANFKLEFLWVHDVDEANNGPARDLCLHERSINELTSPFGIVFSWKNTHDKEVPFEGWSYQPEYFKPPMAFHVGDNSTNLQEPLCICAPFNAADQPEDGGRFSSIEKIRITVPQATFSNTIETANTVDRLAIVSGEAHLMEMWFKNSRDERIDLRPELALIITG